MNYNYAKKYKSKLYIGKNVVHPSMYIFMIVVLSILSLLGILCSGALAPNHYSGILPNHRKN
jgi:hypothetical protein